MACWQRLVSWLPGACALAAAPMAKAASPTLIVKNVFFTSIPPEKSWSLPGSVVMVSAALW
jgi:hypothetical protein